MKILNWLSLTLWSSLALLVDAGELTFDETLIEVLATPDQDLVTVHFNFKSTGEGPAEIERYDAPCSCLEAQISDGGRLTWAAGQEGTVSGFFKVGSFRGTYDKQISLIMSDGALHELTVRMTMPEFVKIEPKTLKWAKGIAPEKQSFEITISDEHPLEILSIKGSNEEKFPFELETLEEGKRYRLSVTPSETDNGGFGLLRITTNSVFKKHQNYQAYVVVSPASLIKPGAKESAVKEPAVKK